MSLAEYIEAHARSLAAACLARLRESAAAQCETSAPPGMADVLPALWCIADGMRTPPEPALLSPARLTLPQLRALRDTVLERWLRDEVPPDARTCVEQLASFQHAGEALLEVSLHERRRDLEQADDRFFASVAHDLRTPLSALYLSAEILARRCRVDEAGEAALQLMRSSARRFNALLGDLQDVAHMRLHGDLPLSLAATDLAIVCHDAVAAARDEHPDREFRLEASTPAVGAWDAPRVSRAVGAVIDAVARGAEADASVRVTLDRAPRAVRVTLASRSDPCRSHAWRNLLDPRCGSRLGAEVDDGENRLGSGPQLSLYAARCVVQSHGGHIRCSDADELSVRIDLPHRAAAASAHGERAQRQPHG